MADDDEVDDQSSFDPTFATAGPRRSTFTPPTASTSAGDFGVVAAPDTAPAEHDDDELAAALAADLTRIAPSIPTVAPVIVAPAEPAMPTPAEPAMPTPAEPAVSIPVEPAPVESAVSTAAAPLEDDLAPAFPPPVGEPVAPPFAVEPPIGAPEAPSVHGTAAGSVPLVASVPFDLTPAPIADSVSQTFDTALPTPAPWSSFPAPDPAQAVPLPVPPDRPVRRSLPDEELLHIADEVAEHPGSTLDAIQQLEAQLQLREQEAREFQEWESTMRVLGTPDAIAAVEEARPEFSDVVASAPLVPPVAPVEPFVDPDVSLAPWPAPVADEVDAPPPPLPAWEVPAPGPNWAPGPEFDFDTEPPVAATHVPAETFAEEFAAPVSDPADEFVESTPRSDHRADPRFDPVVFADTAPSPVVEEIPPLIEPGLFGALGVASAGLDEAPQAPLVPQFPMEAFPPPSGAPEAPSAGDTLELDASTEPESDLVEPPVVAPPAVVVASAPFSFDDLLQGAGDDAFPADDARAFLVASPQALEAPPSLDMFPAPNALPTPDIAPPLIEPMPISAGEAIPTDTGSITLVDQSYEEELPDDVDETDRAFVGLGPVTVDTSGIAVVPGPIHPPSGPISTVRVPPDEVVLGDGEPVRVRAFSLEASGPEPTAVDHRVGRSARLFWLWFASNSSILSIALGATVFAVGMSLRQSIVAVLAGVALSFIPLGLTTLAGKRSGQPTMVVSRATFGLLGNVLPALLALITRVYWGAVLLWLLGSSVAIVLVGAGLNAAVGERQVLLISLAIAFIVAVLVAFAGYPLFSRVQLVLSIVSAILIVGLIALTWKYVNIGTALSTPDGSWTLTISGAVLVFSFVGLVWANSGADLARYQRPGSSGAASMLWATFGTTLPTFVLIGYGALLAASDPGIAKGFLIAPLDTLALMLPAWYPIPLLAATALSLLSGITLTMYSGGFALQAIGVRVRRQWSTVIVAGLLGAIALVLTFGVTGGMTELFRDVATTLAVPTAAWAGIFGAEMMIRNRRFESESLVRRGGIYADVRWFNVIALVLISAIGYGLTTATVTWLSWQGYGFTLLGMPLDSPLAASDFGVLVALVLGIISPLVGGVPAIRKQEAARA